MRCGRVPLTGVGALPGDEVHVQPYVVSHMGSPWVPRPRAYYYCATMKQSHILITVS